MNPSAPGPEAAPASAGLGDLEASVQRRLDRWERQGFPQRIWDRDPGAWPAAAPLSVASRLGWLDLPVAMERRVPEILEEAAKVKEAGFKQVALLGMGGSSRAAMVLARTYPRGRGWPKLLFLDTLHPTAIRSLLKAADLRKTFFLASSKSGTTLEPRSLLAFFFAEVAKSNPRPGDQFGVITDGHSPLEAWAVERAFRVRFAPRSDVGGRYSALSEFGLVPAAFAGLPIRRLLDRARTMAERCDETVPATANPAMRLAAELGELALAGRDKATFLPSPSLTSLPMWIEQLVAESLGKNGRGIVPVVDEVDPLDARGASDRYLVSVTLRGEEDERLDTALADAERGGIPAIALDLRDRHDLGAEFFRWELAVASVGTILEVDPFDQPDVELAKSLAREASNAAGTSPPPGASAPSAALEPSPTPPDRFRTWLSQSRPADFVAVLAYLAESPDTLTALRELRSRLRSTLGLSTVVGIGPGYLHSTGQLFKGGPPNGLFLLLTDRTRDDLAPPDQSRSFHQLLLGQAEGDRQALLQKARWVEWIDLGPEPVGALRAVASWIDPVRGAAPPSRGGGP
ncbi:MAG TPA: hypothetical protein VGV64_03740 [Thermoplasmata archaeon]|nr:hypothetical protein [Thermoplasmata archaeon]